MTKPSLSCPYLKTTTYQTPEMKLKYLCLARKISALRMAAALTQKELAKQVGISRSYLSKLESGVGIPGISIEVLFKLADALDVDPGQLLQIKSRDYKVCEPNMIAQYTKPSRQHKSPD